MDQIERNYSIKLEFDETSSDPVQVFQSYSEIIKSLKNLELLVGRSINRNLNHQQILCEVTAGSIISKIKSIFEFEDDSLAADETVLESQVNSYISGSTAAVFEEISKGPITTEKQIEDIKGRIIDFAEKEDIPSRFNFTPPSVREVIDVVDSIAQSTSKLQETENCSIISDDGIEQITIPKKVSVSVTKIEADLVQDIITTNRQIILRVKKPDYLGEARWVFKHGKKTIEAKIMDQNWLNKFHLKEVVITPGDSLDVDVEMIEQYDRHGNLIKEGYSIMVVKNIIPGRIDDNEE